MNIDHMLEVFTTGHLTRDEAAVMFVQMIHNDPQRAGQYVEAINGLITSGHIVNEQGQWVVGNQPKRKGGRPRGRKPSQRIVVYLDPSMVAELENHRLAGVVSRSDLIKLLLRLALDRQGSGLFLSGGSIRFWAY